MAKKFLIAFLFALIVLPIQIVRADSEKDQISGGTSTDDDWNAINEEIGYETTDSTGTATTSTSTGATTTSSAAATQAKKPALIGGTLLPGIDQKAAIRADSSVWIQNTFLKNAIDIAIGLVAALAVVFLIIGGYQYVTGGEEQIKAAHKTVTFALVGLLLALLSFAIVQIAVNIKFAKSSSSVGESVQSGLNLLQDAARALGGSSEKGSSAGAAESPTSNDSDWNAINSEIDEGIKNDAIKNIDQSASAGSASLLGASVNDIFPTSWNSVKEIKNLPKADIKEEFLPIVARLLVYGISFVAFCIFLFAGAWLVLGWGEDADVKKAKDAIVWAITGIAIAAASYAIVSGILKIDLRW
ncbi:MAG: hypothetical protein V2A63_04345 [Patescibacteria group bacterium]